MSSRRSIAALVLFAATAAGCASALDVPRPRWATKPVLDERASVLLRTHPPGRSRYRTCFKIRMDVLRAKKVDEAATYDLHSNMRGVQFDEIDYSGREEIVLRRWIGAFGVDVEGEGGGTRPVKQSNESPQLQGGVDPLRYDTRRRSFGKRDEPWVDKDRDPDKWEINLSTGLFAPELPSEPVRAGFSWKSPRHRVVFGRDRELEDRVDIDATWRFDGIEHAPSGDRWRFSMEGVFTQRTRSKVLRVDARADVVGALEIDSKDGFTERGWYAVVGKVSGSGGTVDAPGDAISMDLDARLTHVTRAVAEGEVFPAPFGGTLPEETGDPCRTEKIEL